MSALSRFAKSFLGLAAPVVGTALGGPVGGLLGRAVGSAFGPRPTSLMAGGPSVSGTGGPMVETAARVPPLLGRAAGWLISARGVVSTISGRILGVMRGTKLFRNRSVVELVKRIGIDATAVALGITAVDVAQMIAEDAARPRRRARGISATDIRRTKRTIGTIRAIERGLASSGICRPRASRARGGGGAIIRQG